MKVLFFPLGVNPYQSLLIEELSQVSSVKVSSFNNSFIDKHGYLLGILTFPFRLAYFRFMDYSVLHLHWTDVFVIQRKGYYLNKVSLIYIIAFIIWLKILKFRIVWTVHNLKANDGKFIYDNTANKFLSKFVDVKIVHSKENIKEMKKLNYYIGRTNVIPIGNYINVYKNDVTRSNARIRLNLPKSNFIILCFGRIQPYKGIEKLIAQFSSLHLDNATLIIAGPSSNTHYKRKIMSIKDKNIIYKITFIPNEEVQLYYNSADIVACPFEYITTSSSAILAASFARPVIAPLIGNITDFPKNTGFFYDLNDPNGIKKAILRSKLSKKKLLKMGDNSYAYAKTLSWDKIASQTSEIYKSITS